jgi:hypothetical protein
VPKVELDAIARYRHQALLPYSIVWFEARIFGVCFRSLDFMAGSMLVAGVQAEGIVNLTSCRSKIVTAIRPKHFWSSIRFTISPTKLPRRRQ